MWKGGRRIIASRGRGACSESVSHRNVIKSHQYGCSTMSFRRKTPIENFTGLQQILKDTESWTNSLSPNHTNQQLINSKCCPECVSVYTVCVCAHVRACARNSNLSKRSHGFERQWGRGVCRKAWEEGEKRKII